MVRNSADHGLETPEERRRAGKPETGKVTLNAYHEGGHIIIEISDDGKGLPLDKIKAKILQNGLATEAELENMSDQQIQQYIFQGRLLDRRQRSPAFPAAASAWTWCGRTSEDRRFGRDALGRRQGHHVLDQDPADARHRLGADRGMLRRAVRHPANQRGRTGARLGELELKVEDQGHTRA